MSVRTLLLVASVLSSGLMAGLFFGWAVSVIPGTKLVDDRSYLATMQNINREILNPVFIVAFVITPFVLVVAAIAHYRASRTRQVFWRPTGLSRCPPTRSHSLDRRSRLVSPTSLAKRR
ncbi:MAG: putative membrane protein [Acidimicrobiales bacterium]|jgi:uncharacterized membrane protein